MFAIVFLSIIILNERCILLQALNINYPYSRLFNLNFDYTSELEIVYLPVLFFKEALTGTNDDVDNTFNFTIFGQSVSLTLKPNEKLLSPFFKTYVYDDNNFELLPNVKQQCHYIHHDEFSTAAISSCEPNLVQGLLILHNSTYEIQPLTSHTHSVMNIVNKPGKIPHIIRRVVIPPTFDDNYLQVQNNPFLSRSINDKILTNEPVEHETVDILTAEIALFFDAEAYNIFAPYFSDDDDKLREMLLVYMNAIQALYHHPSLGTKLELVLVRLDIMKSQPSDMPHYDGERSKLLDSFCNYQKNLNPSEDDDPEHWDIGLYVSGLDFFAYENGEKNEVTMGLAAVGGVCYTQYACVIAEMGTTNVFGKPYPSAGFTSVYIMAHEIGHNLGMHHDGTKNDCPKEGYIMSPSRGVSGETQWSSCSADVMIKLQNVKCLLDLTGTPNDKLDHSQFNDIPGQFYTAKKQCEILLRDKDANVSPNQELSKICHSIECKTPHLSGLYFAGPALEGTECGREKHCYGGECVPKKSSTTFTGWKPQILDSCNSLCLENSKGYQIRRRFCNNSTLGNTDRKCEDLNFGITLCSDDEVCREVPRMSAIEYASHQCKRYSKVVPQLNPRGVGFQAPHDHERLSIGCAIFCQKSDLTSYYNPRFGLRDLGISPYFPDGTWCHTDNKNVKYFCHHHDCVPEHFELLKEKNKLFNHVGVDIHISQNTNHVRRVGSSELQSYLLGSNQEISNLTPNELEYSGKYLKTRDYIELNDVSKGTGTYKNFDFIE